jgi:hypothetical protein
MTRVMKRLVVVVVLSSVGLASADSSLDVGVPTVGAGMDAAAVRTTVEGSSAKLKACFDRFAVTPDIEGTVTATFTITPAGKITAAKAKGVHPGVASCVATTLTKLAPGKPTGGKSVQVTLPLEFRHVLVLTQGAAFKPLTGSSGGTVGAEAKRGGMRSGPAAGPAGTISLRPPALKGPGSVDKLLVHQAIRASIAKLSDCYNKALAAKPALQGTVTVDFTIGGTGKVTSSLGGGKVDAAVESCFANVIKTIEFAKPAGGDVTVTYAFGLRPAGS